MKALRPAYKPSASSSTRIEMIADISNAGIVNLVQLHGGEDAAYITELRSIARPVVKPSASSAARSFVPMRACVLLLDAFRKDAYGGTGTHSTTR